MNKTTETRHPQNDQRQKMLPRDWNGCQVRITWSAIGGAIGRTGRVVEAQHPFTGRVINQSAINTWIKLDEPIERPRGNDVKLIPIQINGPCDQLEILKARGEEELHPRRPANEPPADGSQRSKTAVAVQEAWENEERLAVLRPGDSCEESRTGERCTIQTIDDAIAVVVLPGGHTALRALNELIKVEN